MRPLITASTPGYIYLLCWRDTPLGNLANPRAQATHYLGFAVDLLGRLAEHAAGRGQHVTAAAVARNMSWEVFYRLGTPALERALKRLKMTPCLCPRCAASRGRRPHHGFQPLAQLVLDLEQDTDFESAPLAPSRADWYEFSILRRWRRPASVCAQTLPDDWDDGLL